MYNDFYRYMIKIFSFHLPIIYIKGVCVYMYITVFETFVGFSDTQRGFLIKEKRFSPEGGETLAFVLYNCASRQSRRFDISDTMNRGDGKIIQHLSPDQCFIVLGEMETLLSEWEFTGIHIHPDVCKSGDREKVISVAPGILDINVKGFFAKEKDQLVLPPFSIQTAGAECVVYKDDTIVFPLIPVGHESGTKKKDDPGAIDIQHMQAWKTPDNCLIVLFSFYHFNTHRIMDILFCHDTSEYIRLSPGGMGVHSSSSFTG
jgi:hypothetical protein